MIQLFKPKLIAILILTTGALALNINPSKAQCEVSANVFPQVICAGNTVTLSATGGCGLLMMNTFDNGTIGTGWSSTAANPVFTNPCGPGPSGAHLWVGTTPSNIRTLVTIDYDVSIGNCSVNWWMRYGQEKSSGDCEDPDLVDEGVHLQWSTDNGVTWTDFAGPNSSPVGPNTNTPPFNTTTPGTGGYWAPPSGGTHGNYPPTQSVYYWHEYESDVPPIASTSSTKFRWAQLNTSDQGYDAWGIDEVEIKCPTGNLNVSWDHGPTSLDPPPVTLPPKGTTYDTCFVVTVSDTINSATDSVCVTVNPIPDSDFSLSDSNVCGDDPVTATYTGSASSGGIYNWDFGSTSVNGQGPHTHNFSSSGQKEVSLVVQENGCQSNKTTKTVEVHPYPSVNAAPNPMEACLNDTISFNNGTQPDSATTWSWDFGDGNTSNQKSPSHLYTAAGTYKVDLTATSAYGCTDSVTGLPITINPNPTAAIDTNWIDYENNELEYNDASQPGNSTSSISDWTWSFGGGANPSSGSSSSESVTYDGQGNYTTTLIVTNNHGCTDTTDIGITIYKLEIPNVITPNNDGYNDVFKIQAIEDDVLQNVSLVIYNRWGKKVFETSNYQNDWDADNLADGTYYYVLSFVSPRGEEKFNGSVTVLRE
ncbi:MAG: gliding motility-associated C-terminal domain-containing protein [Bacteroidales bacterium]|nr:gliding motility-associated C-terminal domain-containing protein [Bacteroidales bacterium]MCF8327422.1 gliding motility-associated C-terminal domain-containing protein [Bacteroidales bacterium]